MSNVTDPEENLAEEFRNLGKNLVSALQAAWDAPERRRLQDEVLSGLNEFGAAIKKEAEQVANSDAGQKFINDVEQLGEKLRSSETQAKVRQELISALKTANSEIVKVIDNWSGKANSPSPDSESAPQAEEQVPHDPSADA